MTLIDDEYCVLEMLIVDGWRLPCDPSTDTLMKPRQAITIPGGNEILVRLRRGGFLDYKNRITQAGREAFEAKQSGT